MIPNIEAQLAAGQAGITKLDAGIKAAEAAGATAQADALKVQKAAVEAQVAAGQKQLINAKSVQIVQGKIDSMGASGNGGCRWICQGQRR